MWTYSALAEPAKKAASKPHFIEQLIPFIFVFFLFYLLLIRPAQKRQKNHQQLISGLKKGDQVITTGGIVGCIYGLTDDLITLEVANQVRIKVVRSQVSGFAAPGQKAQPVK